MLNIEAGVVAAILTSVIVPIVFGIRHIVNEYKQLQKMNCDDLQKQKLYQGLSQPDILCVDAKHAIGDIITSSPGIKPRAVATTVYNTVVDTGLVQIDINYSYEGAYFAVTAINNPTGGYVTVANNITEIDGQVYPINDINGARDTNENVLYTNKNLSTNTNIYGTEAYLLFHI